MCWILQPYPTRRGLTGKIPTQIPFLGMDFAGDATLIAVFMLAVLAFFGASLYFRGDQDYVQLAREMTQLVQDSLDRKVSQDDLRPGKVVAEKMLKGFRPRANPGYFGLALADYWMPMGFGLLAFVVLLVRTICLGFG